MPIRHRVVVPVEGKFVAVQYCFKLNSVKSDMDILQLFSSSIEYSSSNMHEGQRCPWGPQRSRIERILSEWQALQVPDFPGFSYRCEQTIAVA